LSNYAAGVYKIEGEDIFLKIQSYSTNDKGNCKIEVHRDYADVQYMIEGSEQLGYAHKSLCSPKTYYDKTTDMWLVNCDELGYVIQNEGCFCIVFPDDAHQSACIYKTSCNVKKALIKVRLEPSQRGADTFGEMFFPDKSAVGSHRE